MKKFIKQSLLAVTVAAFTTVASAIPTSGNLADLSNGGSIGIGDKTFSGFSFLADGLSGFNPNNITVSATVDNAGVYYLTWGGQMALVSSGFALADLKLNYTVTASAGLIDWIDQSYTGSAQPANGAFLSIDESVYSGTTIVANSHLQVNDLSDPFAEVGDDLITAPGYSTLHVTKDIGFAILSGGFVTISEVKQSFHQIGVPDGGMTVMLLGAALSSLAWANSRRKQ